MAASKKELLVKKYKLLVMDTNIAVKCSSKFKKDFFSWCKKNKLTPTEVLREAMFDAMAKK